MKAKFAPWVDAVMRFEGPIAQQNQRLFAIDWMSATGEDIDDLLRQPLRAPKPGFVAQVIGTGPTVRYSAMPEMFGSLIHAARRELIISTPYYVPNESLQNALARRPTAASARRSSFPRATIRGSSAARAAVTYAELLEAGVSVHEYVGGLLHTKSLTLDGEITLIGSANMDRRSFDLNYENNILIYDAEMTAAITERQRHYLAKSQPVTREMVRAWSMPRRLWNNTLAMLGPNL